jgi:hypothetical protein
MGPSKDDLWQQAFQAFEAHRLATDPNAQAALDRIASKCLRLGERRSFDPSNCTIRQEVLNAEDLPTLERYHNKKTPGRIHEPIVLLEIDGRRLVIDGNKRVNRWIAERATSARAAILIAPLATQTV